jgi:hypothetical protein
MRPINWLTVPPANSLFPRRPETMPDMPPEMTRSRLLSLVARYRTAITDKFRDSEVALERGRARCNLGTDILSAAFESLRARRPPRRLSSRVEAVAAAMCDAHPGVPMVPYWLACQGLCFAVRATCRWAPLALEQAVVDGELIAWIVKRTRPVLEKNYFDQTDGSPWMDLRRAVACADRETYTDAYEAASSIRIGAGPAVRCGLSFAFPSEPDWAREDAFHEVQCVPTDRSEPFPEHLLMLLASLQDAGLALRIVQEAVAHGSSHEARKYAWELVANLGPRAEPALVAMDAVDVLERCAARMSRAMGA